MFVACVVRTVTGPFDADADPTVRDTTELTAAFGVDDDTGAATVDPGDARLALRDPERRTVPPTRARLPPSRAPP